jgi:hypothetical protein
MLRQQAHKLRPLPQEQLKGYTAGNGNYVGETGTLFYSIFTHVKNFG